MAKINIKKNVPVKSLAGRPKKYPFDKMGVGDSFIVESENYSPLTTAKAWAERHKNKWKFKGSKEGSSLTIWRVK